MKVFNGGVLLIVLLLGCRKQVYEKPIDSDILVNAKQESGEAIILCETAIHYPCMNYPIEYSDRRLGKTITIRFTKIPEIDLCLTAPGPAMTSINLGKLDDGEYEVKFKLNGETTEASLVVADSIELKIASPKNVRLK